MELLTSIILNTSLFHALHGKNLMTKSPHHHPHSTYQPTGAQHCKYSMSPHPPNILHPRNQPPRNLRYPSPTRHPTYPPSLHHHPPLIPYPSDTHRIYP